MPDNQIEILLKLKSDTDKKLAKIRNDFKKTAKELPKPFDKTKNAINRSFQNIGVKPFSKVNNEIKKIEASMKILRKSGKLTGNELSLAMKKANSRIKELRTETSKLPKAFALLQSSGVGAFLGVSGAVYAVTRALTGSFQAFADYEQKMQEVNTLLGISSARYNQLKSDIRDLALEIPQTASELATAQYDIISAGVSLDDSLKVLELSAKAAIAGVTDTQTAVQLGIGIVNAYGFEIDRLEDVFNVLFKTVEQGVITFPELAQNMGQVLPAAVAAGVSIDEVASSMAVLTKNTQLAPIAATALAGALFSLAAPTEQARKAMKNLDITWQGFLPTLKQIADRSLTLDELRQLIPDRRAANGVFTLSNNYDELVRVLGEVEQGGGAVGRAYDKMKDTPTNQMILFNNAVTELKFNLGAVTSAGLLPMSQQFVKMIKTMKEFPKVASFAFDAIGSSFNPVLKLILGGTDSFGQLKDKIKETADETKNLKDKKIDLKVDSTDLDTVVEKVGASIETLKDFENQAKKAYQDATKEAEAYGNKIVATEDRIRLSRLSSEDKIRELQRKTMDEYTANYDRLEQAEEKVAQARKLTAQADQESGKAREASLKTAEKLYNEAINLSGQYARAVESEDAQLTKTLEDTTRTAVQKIEQYQSELEKNVYQKQISLFKDLQSEQEDLAATAKDTLDELVEDREAKILITLDRLEEARSSINELIKDETKTITVNVKKVEERAAGGSIFQRKAGALSGFGGGDRVPAMLEAGEFVIRKEAIRKYGLNFAHAFNQMSLPLNLVPHFQEGGYVPDPRIINEMARIDEMLSEFKRKIQNLSTYSRNATFQIDQMLPNVQGLNNIKSANTPEEAITELDKINENFKNATSGSGAKYSKMIGEAAKVGDIELARLLEVERDEVQYLSEDLVAEFDSLARDLQEVAKTLANEEREIIAEFNEMMAEQERYLENVKSNMDHIKSHRISYAANDPLQIGRDAIRDFFSGKTPSSSEWDQILREQLSGTAGTETVQVPLKWEYKATQSRDAGGNAIWAFYNDLNPSMEWPDSPQWPAGGSPSDVRRVQQEIKDYATNVLPQETAGQFYHPEMIPFARNMIEKIRRENRELRNDRDNSIGLVNQQRADEQSKTYNELSGYNQEYSNRKQTLATTQFTDSIFLIQGMEQEIRTLEADRTSLMIDLEEQRKEWEEEQARLAEEAERKAREEKFLRQRGAGGGGGGGGGAGRPARTYFHTGGQVEGSGDQDVTTEGGEYVINKDTVNKIGVPIMDAINSSKFADSLLSNLMVISKFAEGGQVKPSMATRETTSTIGTLNFKFGEDQISLKAEKDSALEFIKALKKAGRVTV